MKRFRKNQSWDILETSPTIGFGNISPANFFGNITNEKILEKSLMKIFLEKSLMKIFWKHIQLFVVDTSSQQIVLETAQTHSQLLLSCHQGLVKWKSGWVDAKHVSDMFSKN